MEKLSLLENINTPDDLKKLPVEALPQLCKELREFIITELSHNPGHLASSLGTVELTVALHYVYDTPDDRLVWDVGHQAYAHKILTGRRERFHTNRQLGGLAPFTNPKESDYDAFIAGHASNSISAALGEEVANEMLAKDNPKIKNKHVVAIIGDGAMTGGLAFEGLNNTSMIPNNLLIVLNDNNMAIDPIKGGFTQYLFDITTSSGYNKWRYRFYKLGKKLHLWNEKSKNNIQRFNNSVKAILSKQQKNIFSGLNLRYFGPADGHDVKELVRIFREIKDYKGARVLHLITVKGKGYAPAENDQRTWHAPGEFCVETGERNKKESALPLWQQVFGNTLLDLAKSNPKIVGITPAMLGGCSLDIMQSELPDRVFDVGIAEGHAVTFSAGLAKEGMLPYCNIYSSFLQRAYDNIIHDVAILGLPVVFCIDRAGLVGEDGITHHGLFDLSFLNSIPGMIVSAPMNGNELRDLLYTAQTAGAPMSIRYPRGKVPETVQDTEYKKLTIGKGRKLKDGSQTAVLSIGAIGNAVQSAIKDLDVAHYDMRFLKPIDTDILDEVGRKYKLVFTAEEGILAGGLASTVRDYFAEKNIDCRVVGIGIKDQFIEHGTQQELRHLCHIDEDGIRQTILEKIRN